VSMGIEGLFIPLGAAADTAPVATCNHWGAQQCWGRPHFTRRRDGSRVPRTLLAWYRRQYSAPRHPDTPERMRLGVRLHTRTPCDAIEVPQRVPICAGRVPAVRRVSPAGQGRLLTQTLRVGKRYRERDVWRT
jgi:hypothetical protein